MSLDLRDLGHGVRLRVRVRPRASREGLGGERGGALLVRVTAPPVDGQANAALVRVVAKSLGVAPSRVRLVQGAAGREKLLEIDGVSRVQVLERLGCEG